MADLGITAADVKGAPGAKTTLLTAGEAIEAGEAVYYEAVANIALLAYAATAAQANAVGVALNDAAEGQPVVVQINEVVDIGGDATEGVIYVVSGANAGKIAPLADLSGDDYVSIVAVGNAAGNLALSIFASGAQDQSI
jgi:predicted transcriptional regulator